MSLSSSQATLSSPVEPAAAMPLADLIMAFEGALENEDWAQIALLNEATRESVEVEMTTARNQGNGGDAASALNHIKPQMEILSVLFQKMQILCASERDKVGAQLKGISSGRTGIQQYGSTAQLS